MEKAPSRRILAIAVGLTFAIGLLVLIAGIVFGIDRLVLREVASPSGKQTAVLHGLGEEDSVPYGVQLVVRPSWVPLKNHFGDPIFAGDCKEPYVLRWRSESVLQFHCASYDRVQIRLESFDGIQLEYQ
jgi:hypothetical protein